jgi:hypothetical protein
MSRWGFEGPAQRTAEPPPMSGVGRRRHFDAGPKRGPPPERQTTSPSCSRTTGLLRLSSRARTVSDLEQHARVALVAAGDRAAALNSFAQAVRSYRVALALWPTADPHRPYVLLKLGRAQWMTDQTGGVPRGPEAMRPRLATVGASSLEVAAALLLGQRAGDALSHRERACPRRRRSLRRFVGGGRPATTGRRPAQPMS